LRTLTILPGISGGYYPVIPKVKEKVTNQQTKSFGAMKIPPKPLHFSKKKIKKQKKYWNFRQIR
jgi:hypothetical protein